MTDSLIGIIKDALSSFEFTQKRGHYPADHWSNRAYAAIEGDASTRKDEDVAKLLKERDGGVNHPPAPSEISVVDQGLRSGLAGFLDARADALHPADDALALGLYADWALEFLAPYLRTPKTTCFYCGHGSGHADDCVRDAKAPEPVSIEEGAKALCRYEHGPANFDEAWASWHANFESLAEQVAVAWGLTCKS